MSVPPAPPSCRMSSEPDALTVVNQLRDLASDPMNRRAIIQDQGCLPGLILFLDHPSPEVVYSALQALRFLSESRSNRERLKSELGMMLSLNNVVHKSTTPGETKLLACEIHELLQTCSSPDSEDRGREPDQEQPRARRKAQFFLGNSNKRAKTIILQIEGLEDTSRSLCEEALLKIRGVISFTFIMAQRRCIVRIRSDLKPESLVWAIGSTQVLKAQQVVKGDDGHEVLVSFPDPDQIPVPLQVQDLPEYLPEDESPSLDPDRAVTMVTTGEGGAGWLGAAANFLSRSFYW